MVMRHLLYMKDEIIRSRNKLHGVVYKTLLKPIFFSQDPERVHDSVSKLGAIAGMTPLGRAAISLCYGYSNSALETEVAGIGFSNPVGLAAGFDKNAELLNILPSVGFGFVEAGSITAKSCAGNPKPRLWRLKDSKSLVVYYGLKNDGADVISKKLQDKDFKIPVGTSLAMTNCKDNLDVEKAIDDYAYSFKKFADIGAYTTVNVSCPNTEGGQTFSDPNNLDKLLSVLDPISTQKPIFVKISPDHTIESLDKTIDVILKHRVHGVISGNLTKNRVNEKIIDKSVPEKGGLSGKPVQDLSDKTIAHIYKRAGDKLVIIGCGGVFTAEDAYKKIKLGASLVQLITGMIYEGPQLVSEINRGLAELLKKDGHTTVNDAVGSSVE